MKVIILAGGGGTRLYPLSNEAHPKQFLCLEDEETLLAHTIRRFLGVARPEDLLILTNERYVAQVRAEVEKTGAQGAHILPEPCRRNTAPAIALAVCYCREVLGCPEEETLVVAPSDAVLRPAALFYQSLHQAAVAARRKKIVVFGVRPDRPETGYGYIEIGKPYGSGYLVRSFKEKPDLETAKRYLAQGNHYWNAGIFTFTTGTFERELAICAPEIAGRLARGYRAAAASFAQMPDVSIDYAVAEKTRNIVVLPLACYWNDLGSWDALYDVLEKDEESNVRRAGDITLTGCRGVLALTQGKPVIGIGLEDLVIVEAEDALLVVRRGRAQEIKEVLAQRRAAGAAATRGGKEEDDGE